MSRSIFAAAAALTILIVAPISAQDCNGQQQPAVPQCPTQNCNSGCNSGCGGKACVPANQLWAGFANEIGCNGCVRCQNLKPNLPGFGGFPACNLQSCTTDLRKCISIPNVSVNWPRPLHGVNAACNSLKPKLHDAFNVFGLGKQKKVRCDIPNDCFGRLGESKACDSSYFQPLPPVPSAEHGIQPSPTSVLPPAPVPAAAPMVEPVPAQSNDIAPSNGHNSNDSAMLPPVNSPNLNDSAKNSPYGVYYRAKR